MKTRGQRVRPPSSLSSANTNPTAPILCRIKNQRKYCRIVKHARLVRTDTGPPESSGTFLPCYALDTAVPDFRVVLPLAASSRDKSLDEWFETAKNSVLNHADAVVQILVRARPRSSPEGAYRTTTGTAFIVEGPDRVHAYLCTTLHTIIDSAGWGYNGAYVRDVEIWIAEDEDRRRDDLFTKFDGLKEYDVSLESRGFQRVEIGSEALDERVEFLKGLEEQKAVENCFLDPEFGLYAVPILDVTFLHLPPTLKMAVESEKIKPLRVATKAPKPGQPFVAIAYHDVEEPMEADVYCSTMPVTLKAKTFIHSGRSCTLGKFASIGQILTTSFNSTCATSGCPLIDEDGYVYGINMASYYDKGREDTTPPASLTSAASAAGNPRKADMGSGDLSDPQAWVGPLPTVEAGAPEALRSRNRNIAISVDNAGFRAIFDSASKAVSRRSIEKVPEPSAPSLET